MASKNETKDPAPGTLEAARRSMSPRRRRPEPPMFDTPREERAWYAEQQRIERELEAAYRECPPGTRMFVTTARGIPSRGRAGLRFGAQGRTEVEVVDLDDGQLALARALATSDKELLERLRRGDTVPGLEEVDVDVLAAALSAPSVTPVGALAIKRDDGLLVLDDAGGKAAKEIEAKNNEIAERDGEILRLREQLAAVTRGNGTRSPNDGGPERLARTAKAGTPPSSEAFGGEDTDKAGKKG